MGIQCGMAIGSVWIDHPIAVSTSRNVKSSERDTAGARQAIPGPDRFWPSEKQGQPGQEARLLESVGDESA